MFRNTLALCVAIALLSAPVFAGGSGGSKRDGTINISNDTSGTALVILNPSTSLQSRAAAGTATLAEFTQEGGKVLQATQTASFKVKAGTSQLYYLSVTSTGTISSVIGPIPQEVGRGQTVSVMLSGL